MNIVHKSTDFEHECYDKGEVIVLDGCAARHTYFGNCSIIVAGGGSFYRCEFDIPKNNFLVITGSSYTSIKYCRINGTLKIIRNGILVKEYGEIDEITFTAICANDNVQILDNGIFSFGNQS